MKMLRIANALSVLMFAVTTATAAELPPPLSESDFPEPNMAEVKLGQLLFFDPLISGNRNISCATCHHPRFATGDGVSLGIGEGGLGIGPDREPDPENMPEQRIPRNSPPLFNLGARMIRVMFHDGRIEVDPTGKSGFRTPLGEDMVEGFDGILSAQSMFPVVAPDEMAGHYQENDIAKAVRQGRITGEGGAWDIIAARVAAITRYRQMFEGAYPEISSGRQIEFADIANAIAAFIAFEWRSFDSPFDKYLRGEGELEEAARRGLELFYGKAGCADCHSGPLLTDQEFHPMGQPQLGPGKAERFETHQKDIGRMRVTGRPADAYAFRTPSLRNVFETGPWGHAGAFRDLRQFLQHHADPAGGLDRYAKQAILPDLSTVQSDWAIMDDPGQRGEIRNAANARRTELSEDMVDDLLQFLGSLSDPVALGGRLGAPDRVPSGLPVDR